MQYMILFLLALMMIGCGSLGTSSNNTIEHDGQYDITGNGTSDNSNSDTESGLMTIGSVSSETPMQETNTILLDYSEYESNWDENWFNNIPYPCDPSTVRLIANRQFLSCTLSEPAEIQGFQCGVHYPTSFYHNSSLRSCGLTQPITVQDIPCSDGYPIVLYDSGKIKSCKLSQAIRIGGKDYQKDFIIILSEG